MGVEYSKVDWRTCLEVLVPAAEFTGNPSQLNQDAYENGIVWTDGRPKPTWADLINVWTNFSGDGSGVLLEPWPPGAYIYHHQTSDFGNWLYIDPANGRILDKNTYQMLYKVIGNTYNGQYGGIAGTEFGLPKGVAGRFPVVAGSGYAIGAMAGAASTTLTTSHLPEHNHSLDPNIVRQQTGLTLFGLSGVVSINPAGKIASAVTGNAGSASPTAIPTLPPYWAAGNLFIYRGKLKYDDTGGTNYF